MKLLVLGKNGQVGSAILDAAASTEMCAVGLGREDCDLTDEHAIRGAISGADADVVINAAAYTAVDKAESEPSLATCVNGLAPGWVADQCASDNRLLIHISTDFVFNGNKGAPYLPSDLPAPVNVYGKSKLLGEENVIEALPDALILRTSWIYSTIGSNFLLTMLRLLRERGQVSVVDDQIGSPTCADDIASAIIDLALRNAKGICHYTNEGVASWYDFALAICEDGHNLGLVPAGRLVVPIPSSEYPTSAKRPANSVLDKQEMRMLLGRDIPHWRQSLRNTLKELRENG